VAIMPEREDPLLEPPVLQATLIEEESLPAKKADKKDAETEMVLAAKANSGKISGKASWYGPGLWGNPTASGQPLRYKLTAAHKSLPIGTCLRVVNVRNHKSTHVRINDRGPFIPGRIIDLNERAARKIGMISSGVANVSLEKRPKSECKDGKYQNP
jgi:rare lipoprotein A